MANEELEFYDVKSKEKFKTTDYKVIEKEMKGGRVGYFAIAKSPTGTHECWKILGKDKAKELMAA